MRSALTNPPSSIIYDVETRKNDKYDNQDRTHIQDVKIKTTIAIERAEWSQKIMSLAILSGCIMLTFIFGLIATLTQFLKMLILILYPIFSVLIVYGWTSSSQTLFHHNPTETPQDDGPIPISVICFFQLWIIWLLYSCINFLPGVDTAWILTGFWFYFVYSTLTMYSLLVLVIYNFKKDLTRKAPWKFYFIAVIQIMFGVFLPFYSNNIFLDLVPCVVRVILASLLHFTLTWYLISKRHSPSTFAFFVSCQLVYVFFAEFYSMLFVFFIHMAYYFIEILRISGEISQKYHTESVRIRKQATSSSIQNNMHSNNININNTQKVNGKQSPSQQDSNSKHKASQLNPTMESDVESSSYTDDLQVFDPHTLARSTIEVTGEDDRYYED